MIVFCYGEEISLNINVKYKRHLIPGSEPEQLLTPHSATISSLSPEYNQEPLIYYKKLDHSQVLNSFTEEKQIEIFYFATPKVTWDKVLWNWHTLPSINQNSSQNFSEQKETPYIRSCAPLFAIEVDDIAIATQGTRLLVREDACKQILFAKIAGTNQIVPSDTINPCSSLFINTMFEGWDESIDKVLIKLCDQFINLKNNEIIADKNNKGFLRVNILKHIFAQLAANGNVIDFCKVVIDELDESVHKEMSQEYRALLWVMSIFLQSNKYYLDYSTYQSKKIFEASGLPMPSSSLISPNRIADTSDSKIKSTINDKLTIISRLIDAITIPDRLENKTNPYHSFYQSLVFSLEQSAELMSQKEGARKAKGVALYTYTEDICDLSINFLNQDVAARSGSAHAFQSAIRNKLAAPEFHCLNEHISAVGQILKVLKYLTFCLVTAGLYGLFSRDRISCAQSYCLARDVLEKSFLLEKSGKSIS